MFCVQAKFGHFYASLGDLESRKGNFLATKAYVDNHNAEFKRGLHSYTCGINDFSALVSGSSLSTID